MTPALTSLDMRKQLRAVNRARIRSKAYHITNLQYSIATHKFPLPDQLFDAISNLWP